MNFFRIINGVFDLSKIAYIDFSKPTEIWFAYNEGHKNNLSEEESARFLAMKVLPNYAIRVGDYAINLDRLAYADLTNYEPGRKKNAIQITFVGITKDGLPLPKELKDGDADQFYQYIQNYYPSRW